MHDEKTLQCAFFTVHIPLRISCDVSNSWWKGGRRLLGGRQCIPALSAMMHQRVGAVRGTALAGRDGADASKFDT